MLTWRKIRNISPGFIEAREDFLVGLYSGGLVIRGSFRLADDLHYQHSMRKTSEKGKSKYRGSMFALSIVIHCPIYAHRISNVGPKLILERFTLGRIFEFVSRGELHSGGLVFGILWYSVLFVEYYVCILTRGVVLKLFCTISIL